MFVGYIGLDGEFGEHTDRVSTRMCRARVQVLAERLPSSQTSFDQAETCADKWPLSPKAIGSSDENRLAWIAALGQLPILNEQRPRRMAGRLS
jgi:hypothetical protein